MGTLYIIVGTCAILFFGMGIGLFMGQNLCDIGKLVQAPYFDDYTEIIKSKTIEPVTELDIEIPLDLEVEVSGMTIPEQIRQIAQEQDFIDEDLLVNIAYCESSFRKDIRGDNGHSRGLFQINDIAYPEITDAQAFSISWSTNWAIDRIKAGQEYKEWKNCMRKIEDYI